MAEWLRRSALYVPGDSEKMLQRAASSGADMLLLNLEDGVARSRKDAARANVKGALDTIAFGGAEVVVRINSMLTAVGVQDLAAVVPSRPHGICLPKVERAGQLQEADTALLELEIAYGIPEGSLRLHAMIESAAGVLHAAEIARSSPRMASLIFGSADYVADVGCRPGPDRSELAFALQMIVTAARAAGIDALDAPCFDLRNAGQLRDESVHARRLGFAGKSALRPGQIEVIHDVFGVRAEDIAWAEKVLEELDRAEERGRALSTIDGNLIDNPHRIAAERILRRKPPGTGRA